MIVVGGVIPPQDYEALHEAGASAIFPPGTVIAEAAEKLIARAEPAPGLRAARRRRSDVVRTLSPLFWGRVGEGVAGVDRNAAERKPRLQTLASQSQASAFSR